MSTTAPVVPLGVDLLVFLPLYKALLSRTGGRANGIHPVFKDRRTHTLISCGTLMYHFLARFTLVTLVAPTVPYAPKPPYARPLVLVPIGHDVAFADVGTFCIITVGFDVAVMAVFSALVDVNACGVFNSATVRTQIKFVALVTRRTLSAAFASRPSLWVKAVPVIPGIAFAAVESMFSLKVGT